MSDLSFKQPDQIKELISRGIKGESVDYQLLSDLLLTSNFPLRNLLNTYSGSVALTLKTLREAFQNKISDSSSEELSSVLLKHLNDFIESGHVTGGIEGTTLTPYFLLYGINECQNQEGLDQRIKSNLEIIKSSLSFREEYLPSGKGREYTRDYSLCISSEYGYQDDCFGIAYELSYTGNEQNKLARISLLFDTDNQTIYMVTFQGPHEPELSSQENLERFNQITSELATDPRVYLFNYLKRKFIGEDFYQIATLMPHLNLYMLEKREGYNASHFGALREIGFTKTEGPFLLLNTTN